MALSRISIVFMRHTSTHILIPPVHAYVIEVRAIMAHVIIAHAILAHAFSSGFH